MRDEILQYLYESRYTMNPDVIGFLKREFPKIIQEQARDNLLQMVDESLIAADKNAIIGFFPRDTKMALMENFPEQTMNFKLIKGGTAEAKENIFKKQIAETNQALIKQSGSSITTNTSIRMINNTLRITNIIGLVVAGATGFFIAMQFFRGGATNQPQINRQLERRTQILDSMLQVQIRIDSSLRTMAKDSVKKIYVLK